MGGPYSEAEVEFWLSGWYFSQSGKFLGRRVINTFLCLGTVHLYRRVVKCMYFPKAQKVRGGIRTKRLHVSCCGKSLVPKKKVIHINGADSRIYDRLNILQVVFYISPFRVADCMHISYIN